MQQIGLHLGYISKAFGALSSQVNEDISKKKTDFASNSKTIFFAKLTFRVVALQLLKFMMF